MSAADTHFRFDDKMNFDFHAPSHAHARVDASLSEIEQAELIRRLAEAEAAYTFRHVLVQDTAHSTLLKQERRRLHQQVAESLVAASPNDLDALAATLSEHYWQSEVWDKTAEFAVLAGSEALRVYALREAFVQFDRALLAIEQLPSANPLMRYDAWMGWAEAATKLRPYSEQLEKLGRAEEIARELNDKPRLARALYRIGSVYIANGYAFRSTMPFVEVFTLAKEVDDERFAIIPTFSMGLVTIDTNPREALGLLRRALELAEKYNDYDSQGTTWSILAMAYGRLGEFAHAREAIANAEKCLGAVKSPMTVSDVYLFIGWALLEIGDADKGLEYARQSVQAAAATGNRDCECNAFDCVGFCELTVQHVPEAIAAFREAIHHSQYSGAEFFENVGRGGKAIAEFYAGRQDAVADLEQAHARTRELHDHWGGAVFAQALGSIYAARGENAQAEDMLLEASSYFRPNQIAPKLIQTLELLAQLYSQQGRAVEAEEMMQEAREWKENASRAAA